MHEVSLTTSFSAQRRRQRGWRWAICAALLASGIALPSLVRAEGERGKARSPVQQFPIQDVTELTPLTSTRNADEWTHWCDRMVSTIGHQMTEANIDLAAGEPGDAIDKLFAIYQTILAEGEAGPVTVRLARLLHDVAELLHKKLPDNAAGDEQILKYLTESLQFLAEETGHFDRNVFVPYRFSNGGKRRGQHTAQNQSGSGYDTFQAEYIGLTNRVIRFILDHFVSDLGHKNFVPQLWAGDIGDPVLNAARMTADFVLAELQMNLFNGAVPCTLTSMKLTSESIRKYLAGGNRSIAADRLRLGLSYNALYLAGLSLQVRCD